MVIISVRNFYPQYSELMSGEMSAILFAIFAITPHNIAVDSTD